jgi:predicted transcriptional regulator
MKTPTTYPLFATGPVAHRADPLSSHAAGEKAHNNGTARTHTIMILSALKVFGGQWTSRQLAAKTNIEYHAVARRMKELETSSLVRRIDNGTEPSTWEAI